MRRTATIAEVCELVTDGTHYTPLDVGTGVPFLTVKDVSNRGLDFAGSSRISNSDFAAAVASNSVPRKGDVLFSKDGTVGKVHLVRTDERFAVLSSLAILRPRVDVVDAGYLAHALRSPSALGQALSRKTGSAIRRIVLADLRQVEVPIPSVPEQRRIAAILDQADALRAKRREALAHLDTLPQAMFRGMFGDGEDESARRVGPFAAREVSDVCELVVDCVNRTAPVVSDPTPYKMLRTTNVRGGVVNTSEVRYADAATFERWNRRATPRAGDVLLTREAPVGEAGILETDERVFLGQRLMLYRPDPLKITSEYLLAAFQSPYLQAQFGKHGSGTTVKHLPLPACRSFLVPLPPLELQAEFSRRVRAVRGLRSASVRELREWEALFDSLQHQAFVGAL